MPPPLVIGLKMDYVIVESSLRVCICTVKIPAPGMLLILMGMVAGKMSSRVMLLLPVQTTSVSDNTMIMLIGTMVKSQSAAPRVQ